MNMFKNIMTISALLLTVSPAVHAQSSAGADAAAASQAGAEINEGTNWGGASVGSAYCTDGVAIGPIAISTTIRACIAGEIAAEGGQLGTLTREEVGAVQRAVLSDLGYGVRTVPAPTTERASALAPQQPAAVPTPPAFEPYKIQLLTGGSFTIPDAAYDAAFRNCGEGIPMQQLDGTVIQVHAQGC